MATYYIRKSGNDANAGTSPSAAWASFGKALGTTGISSGDVVYVGAGVYRETITVSMTSATAETKIIGDVDGKQTGDAGDVRLTAFTAGDSAAPSGNTTLDTNGRSYLTFQGIIFESGSSRVLDVLSVASTNLKFIQCSFFSVAPSFVSAIILNGSQANQNFTFDRCTVFAPIQPYGFNIGLDQSSTAEYDANIIIQNCVIFTTTTGVNVSWSGVAGSFNGGGVRVYNSTITGNYGGVTGSANLSTTVPALTVYNSIIMAAAIAFNANTAGQIVEDYNRILAGTSYQNVTGGAHSVTGQNQSLLLEFGQSMFTGRNLRPWFSPASGSPLLGFGNHSGGPTVDIMGVPRPSGGGSAANAVGAFEFKDSGMRETTVTRTGANSLKIAGPGMQDFYIPVNPVSTTISIYGRYDSNYSGTLPQMLILNGGECGVSDAAATMQGAANNWELLSLNFTPASKGIVTVRLQSNSTAASGNAYFDDFGISP